MDETDKELVALRAEVADLTRQVSSNAAQSPAKELPIKGPSSGAAGLLKWTTVIVAGVLGLCWLIAANDPTREQRLMDREAYQLCQKMAVSTGNPGACEGMRKDYWAKYNREP